MGRRELEDSAQRIAGLIGSACDSLDASFALLLMQNGKGKWTTWVSNVERECMIEMLEEMLETLRTKRDVKPMRQN